MANEPLDNDFIQYWSAYGCWVTRTTPLVDHIDEATSAHGVTIDGVTLKDGGALVVTGGTNTFNLTNGTASLDVAAGAAVNVDDDVTISKALTVNGSYGTTIASEGQANTVTLNEGLTVGDGYSGTLTFSAASKTITVEDTSTVNQDLTTDASPTFVTANLTGLTDGKIPYHVADATGLADGPTKADVDSAISLKHSAATVSTPLSITDQAISIVNDAAATVTAVETTLTNTATKIPASSVVYTGLAAKLNITSLVLPFYKADGNLDTIPLTSDQKLPFFNAAGSSNNIALTT
jgi:hypothetical protein